MIDKSLVEALQKKAAEDPVANSIFTAFTLRERDRSNLTVIGLSQTMNNLGLAYRADQYSDFLKFLASLGIGELKRDKKGKGKELKDINLSLISIGKAALLYEGATLKPFEARATFETLVAEKVAKKTKEVKNEVVVAKDKTLKLGLTFHINGKIIEIPIPENLGEHEVAKMVLTLRGNSAAI